MAINPWSYIKNLIIAVSGFGKTNTLLNLIKQQKDDAYNITYQIYLYIKDPNELIYHYLIENH